MQNLAHVDLKQGYWMMLYSILSSSLVTKQVNLRILSILFYCLVVVKSTLHFIVLLIALLVFENFYIKAHICLQN